MNPNKPYIFYDANCFTTVPSDDLNAAINESNNFLVDAVIQEIKKGLLNNPDNRQLASIVNANGSLHKGFTEINLGYSEKDPSYNLDTNSIIYLRKNPITCSAYYTWLASAINPATIHDLLRHTYNEILFRIKNGDQNIENFLKLESRLRVEESQRLEKYYLSVSRNPINKPHWLLKSRRKRLDEAKTGKIKLSDYQTLVSAFIYGCFLGKNCLVLTADRDFIDILDNLYKSLIERYSVNKLIKQHLESFPESMHHSFFPTGVDIELSMDKIADGVLDTLKKIDGDKQCLFLIVWLYRADYNKFFPHQMKIPVWLRDFSLSYKKNINCASLDSKIESQYTISYTMHPNFTKKTVKYIVKQKPHFSEKICISSCEKFCKYPKIEAISPTEFTEFLA